MTEKWAFLLKRYRIMSPLIQNMSRFVAVTSAVGTRQLARRAQLVSGNPSPRAAPSVAWEQWLLCPQGEEDLLAAGTYSQHRNLVETFCTCDTQKSFIKETKFPDAQCKGTLFSSYWLHQPFRREYCCLPRKKMRKEII
jgi:hypothetical protein